MVSDTRKQAWKENAEEHEEIGSEHESAGRFEKAVKHFVRAANYYDDLADVAESERLAGANSSKAESLRSRAKKARMSMESGSGGESGGSVELSVEDLSDEELELLTSDGEEWSDLSESQKKFRLNVREEVGSHIFGEVGCASDSSGVSGSRGCQASSTDDLGVDSFFESAPEISLDDVAGLEDVKHRFHEDVVFPLENREYYERHGVGIVNGVLMYGPPGTGKTYTARAVAGELGVPFAEVSPAQMSSKMVGEASDLVEELFDESLELEPCVVFLDEVDSLANSRGSGMQQTRSERQSVTQLLEEMERIQGSEVLVVAATNLKSDVDGAMLRSGRFSTHIEVPEPDAETRRAVFQKHLEDKQTEGDFDFELLGKASDGFSCSDVAECVGDAVRCAARESAERGELRPVRYRHLLQSVKKCEPSLKQWSDS